MKFFRKKRNIIIIAAVIILILIILRCNTRSTALPVMTGEVTIGTINEYVRTAGELEPYVDIKISSDITGKAEVLYVDDGDMVKKGAKLVQLDNTSYRATLQERESAFTVAKANLAYEQFIYDNQKALYNDSLISFSEYKTAQLKLDNAQAQYESALSALEIARDNMKKTLLTSPIDGLVSAVYVEEGENVITGTMNNAGTVLMTVSDNSKMLLKCNVDETSVVLISKGNKAEITFDAFPDTVYTGVVTKIANRPDPAAADEGTVFPVEILIEGRHVNLLSGMNAEVAIITASKENVIKAPIQSVVTRNSQEGVFIVEGGKAVFIPVQSGIIGKESIEVDSEKLKEGDRIVTGPFTSLKRINNNDRVIDRESPGKPGFSPKQ